MKYRAIWIQDSPARKPGWYVLDIRRSRPSAVVLIGDRHETDTSAQSEARRLEIEERVR